MLEYIKADMKKNKINCKLNKPPFIYLFSVLKGLIFSFFCILAVSLLHINNGTFNGFTKIIIYVAIGIGSFITGYTAFKRLKGRGIVNGFISSLIYSVVYITILLVITGFQVNERVLLVPLVILFFGILGGIVSANKQ